MRNLYEVLGVSPDATPGEIKRAYRALAHQHHPDKNPGDAGAEERFKEATHAYDVLSDSNQRQRYDRFGAAGGFNFGQGGFAQNVGDVFSDIFGDFFGKKTKAGPQKGRDRTLHLEVDFASAAHGGEHQLAMERAVKCAGCDGSGAQSGTVPKLCHACAGTGEIKVQQGIFALNKRCTYCRGRGQVIETPCTSCKGRGTLPSPAEVTVRVPTGADSGLVLRLAGEGEAGYDGGANGDLRVILQVRPHHLFRREGADLYCDLPVTPSEAALGASVEVPTLQGRVRMKLPAGTRSGRTLRLRRKGLPRLGSDATGDLHITVEIETPQELSSEQRRSYEEVQRLETPENFPARLAVWQKHQG